MQQHHCRYLNIINKYIARTRCRCDAGRKERKKQNPHLCPHKVWLQPAQWADTSTALSFPQEIHQCNRKQTPEKIPDAGHGGECRRQTNETQTSFAAFRQPQQWGHPAGLALNVPLFRKSARAIIDRGRMRALIPSIQCRPSQCRPVLN